MDGFFKEKEWIELEKYFKQKILPAGKQLDQSHYRLGLLKNIKIIELKGILSIKAIYAQDKDVEFRLDVANEITYFDMDIIDLCRCVGIILDNAIEAALMSKSKRVDCGIIKRKKSVLIVVHNTYDGENIDIRKIYNKGYTTKSKDDKSRGLGLFTLKRITDSYSNVNMEAEIDNKEFKIGIEVLKK
jgi:two-component system sensor histidine kinase AgrC